MSDPEVPVCGEHGETASTFLCRHLVLGIACGHHALEEADDPWPDAWCDLCDEVFRREGEWNEASAAVAGIRLVCAHCHEAARARNREVPPHARGAGRRLTSEEAAVLVAHASRTVQAAQAASRARWGWGEMASWDYDADTGTVAFTDPRRPTVLADVQLVGSYSTRSRTFQWAWATLDDGDSQGAVASRLRVFGEVRGMEALTTAKWDADEMDGWEMASLAGYLARAEGLYRAPYDHLYWYMLLGNWRGVS